MHRRAFLHRAALTATAASLSFSPRSRAAVSDAPLFISIEANQAWDTTTSIDPHGHNAFSIYRESDIREVGSLRIAPFDASEPGFNVRRLHADGSAATIEFFDTYGEYLRVINGVDHRTVSHDIGPRNAFSGSLREGFPAIGALVAAVQGPRRPLAFVSTGGFDDTQGIVTLTRSGKQSVLRELARPNTTAGLSTNATYLPPSVEALVQRAQEARDARRSGILASRRALPKALRSHAALIDARAAEGGFLDLANILDASSSTSDSNQLISAAGLVLAAMRSDPAACTSAHLAFGNFDTHFDHDVLATGHRARMRSLLEGIGHIIEEIENNPANAALRARGVLIYVSSDFGRTAYNGGEDDETGRGKDHWPVTSSMVIGLGAMKNKVGGGTVLGRTTPTVDGIAQPGLKAFPVRVDDNGNLVTADRLDAAGHFQLTATEVNACLRQALHLDEEVPSPGTPKLVQRFALPEVEPAITATLAAGRNPLLKDT
ncbi:MAG TPA: DUF1501 domain-containing protein [Myxococcota bacterium]